MPLEIRELVIKAVVDPEVRSEAPSSSTEREEGDREALVAECVAQVLEILREKAER